MQIAPDLASPLWNSFGQPYFFFNNSNVRVSPARAQRQCLIELHCSDADVTITAQCLASECKVNARKGI